jgi:hypothetical protein
MMNELKVAFIITGRAIQTMSSMMRENPETKAVKHPEFLDLILIAFPFCDSSLRGRRPEAIPSIGLRLLRKKRSQ